MHASRQRGHYVKAHLVHGHVEFCAHGMLIFSNIHNCVHWIHRNAKSVLGNFCRNFRLLWQAFSLTTPNITKMCSPYGLWLLDSTSTNFPRFFNWGRSSSNVSILPMKFNYFIEFMWAPRTYQFSLI